MNTAGPLSAVANAIKLTGADLVLTVNTISVYVPSLSTLSVSTSTYACKGLVDTSGLGEKFGIGLVQAGDIRLTVAAKNLTVTPEVGNKITLATVVHTIKQVQPVYLAGTILLYDLLARR